MIHVEHLVKRFGNVTAVNDLTLNVEKGVVGLVGENGAGKSTLLRLISGVYDADSGLITVDNFVNTSIEAKKKIFFLCDKPFFPVNTTVKEVLKLYSALFDVDEDRFYSIMEKLKLPTERKLATFSKGMQRQFFIAVALSIKADYLLLDEAFDGLDPLVLEVIRQEIIDRSKDTTFLLSSHNMSSLERLCSSFIILSKGRLIKDGDAVDMGENMFKYQILFKEIISKEKLEADGFSLISYKNVGSIVHIVTKGDLLEDIKKKYRPILIEQVAIDPDELIVLQMMDAKKERGE